MKTTKITKKKFKELTGEDPVDVLGPDWNNYIDDFLEGVIFKPYE